MIAELLRATGYGSVVVLGRDHDGGVDGWAARDRLVEDRIWWQAKRWGVDRLVREATLRDFAGALLRHPRKVGVFLTTAEVSATARRYADEIRPTGVDIRIVGRRTLGQLLHETHVDVDEVRSGALLRRSAE